VPAGSARAPFTTQTPCTGCSSNVAYAGKVRYKDEVHDGDTRPSLTRRSSGAFRTARESAALPHHCAGPRVLCGGIAALLLLRRAYDPAHTTNGGKRYRYYVCLLPRNAAARLPVQVRLSQAIERFVLERLPSAGRRSGPGRGRHAAGRGGGGADLFGRLTSAPRCLRALVARIDYEAPTTRSPSPYARNGPAVVARRRGPTVPGKRA